MSCKLDVEDDDLVNPGLNVLNHVKLLLGGTVGKAKSWIEMCHEVCTEMFSGDVLQGTSSLELIISFMDGD